MNEHARVARLLQHRLFGPPNRFSTLSQSTSTHSVRRKRMRHDPAFRSSAFLLMIAVAVFPRNGSLTLKAQDLAPSIYFTFRPLRCDDHARQMEGFPNYQFCAARSLLSSVFHGSRRRNWERSSRVGWWGRSISQAFCLSICQIYDCGNRELFRCGSSKGGHPVSPLQMRENTSPSRLRR